MTLYQILVHNGLGVQECPTITSALPDEIYKDKEAAEKRADDLWKLNTTEEDRKSHWCAIHYSVKQIEVKLKEEIMSKVKIALDVDDVLCQFAPYAHAFHKVPMPEKIDYWCERTMNGALGTGWFDQKIAPVEEFWRTIPILSKPEDINFDVSYYISAFPENMHKIRVEWLRQHGFPDAPLICTFDKLAKCIELGVTHLVDDKPATIQKLQGTSIKGIHFITPYAGFEPVGDAVITNLNQLNKYL
jgi:hypothetical protein